MLNIISYLGSSLFLAVSVPNKAEPGLYMDAKCIPSMWPHPTVQSYFRESWV